MSSQSEVKTVVRDCLEAIAGGVPEAAKAAAAQFSRLNNLQTLDYVTRLYAYALFRRFDGDPSREEAAALSDAIWLHYEPQSLTMPSPEGLFTLMAGATGLPMDKPPPLLPEDVLAWMILITAFLVSEHEGADRDGFLELIESDVESEI